VEASTLVPSVSVLDLAKKALFGLLPIVKSFGLKKKDKFVVRSSRAGSESRED
jgi:hypothetical protein